MERSKDNSPFAFTLVLGKNSNCQACMARTSTMSHPPDFTSFKLVQSIKYNNDGSRRFKIYSMNCSKTEPETSQMDEEDSDVPGGQCTDGLAPLLHHCRVVPPVSHHLLGCLPIRRCWEAPGAS